MTIAPRLPNFLDQIQFLKFWMLNDCNLPYMMYVETALPIAGEIAIAYLEIDAGGFVKSLLRPKTLRSGRHTRRGPRGKRRRGGIPEPADMLADLLDPDHTLRPRRVGLGTQFLLEFSDLTERVGYALFLADVIEGGIINSIIGAIEILPSNCPNVARLHRTMDFGTVGGATPGFVPYNMAHLDYANLMSAGTGFTTQTFQGTVAVVWGMTVRKITIPGTIEVRLQRTSPNPATLASLKTEVLEPGDQQQIVISAKISPGDVIQWQTDVDPGFAQILFADLFAMQIAE